MSDCLTCGHSVSDHDLHGCTVKGCSCSEYMGETFDPERFPTDEWLEGMIAARPMADGRAWCLIPLTFGRLRIVIAPDEFSMGEHW